MNTTEAPVAPPPAATENKTVAIVSYLTLIGFIVAIILHASQKTRLGAFHLRQSLGLMLAAIAVGIVDIPMMMVPFIGWIIALAAWVALFVFWVMGLVAAANGELKPLPVIGEPMQKWLGTAFD